MTYQLADNIDVADPEESVISPIPHVPRNFHKYEGAQYVLPSDDKDADLHKDVAAA